MEAGRQLFMPAGLLKMKGVNKMKWRQHVFTYVILACCAAVILTACGPRGSAAVSEEYIADLAERKMQAVNSGDYDAFIEDFSDPLKEAITEERFLDLRETILAASGQFDSIISSRVANARTQGYLNYIYNCQFEEENVLLTLVYALDGDKIEGIFFSGTKLNQAMQE